MTLLLQISLGFFAIAVFSSLLFAMFSFAPWVPTPEPNLQQVLEMAQIKSGERFYDLGCGDGRVVIYAAKQFGAKATGFEIAIPRFISAYFKCKLSRTPNANIVFGNLFNKNLSDADVIYVYGAPPALEKQLRPKFERECKPGTRIISFIFEIPGWESKLAKELGGKLHKKEVNVRLYVL